ncbi:hypothetical protein [Halanaerobium salsuginis]|nr:hypothetical protein [Halanaerobium salsuginis]
MQTSENYGEKTEKAQLRANQLSKSRKNNLTIIYQNLEILTTWRDGDDGN